MSWSLRSRTASEDSLEALWRLASTASLHGAFCACSGGGAFAISSQQLEDDILDYLAERYARNPDVGEALRRRRESKTATFVNWLDTVLGGEEMSDLTVASIRHDVVTVLRSIANPDGGLVCR